MAISAEDAKSKGNAAYHDRRYDEAVRWYSDAIKLDDTNAVYYNNRAAAYLELKKYSEAASDAERSAILAPSGKANGRHGKALWHLGKIDDAIAAYERALRHDHGNPEYTDALRSLKASSGSSGRSAPSYTAPPASGSASSGGAAVSPLTLVRLDLGILVCAILAFVLIFFSPGLSLRAWQGLVLCLLGRQLATVANRNGPATLKTFGFWKDYVKSGRVTNEFEGQYMALCLVFLITSAPAQQIFVIAASLYAAVDLCCNHDALLRNTLPPSLLGTVAPRLAQVRQNKDQLVVQAAAFEGMSLFLTPFSGASFILVIVVTQFVKWRYVSDGCSRMAWSHMHRQVYGYAHSPRVPGVIGSLFDKFAALLHRGATGSA